MNNDIFADVMSGGGPPPTNQYDRLLGILHHLGSINGQLLALINAMSSRIETLPDKDDFNNLKEELRRIQTQTQNVNMEHQRILEQVQQLKTDSTQAIKDLHTLLAPVKADIQQLILVISKVEEIVMEITSKVGGMSSTFGKKIEMLDSTCNIMTALKGSFDTSLNTLQNIDNRTEGTDSKADMITATLNTFDSIKSIEEIKRKVDENHKIITKFNTKTIIVTGAILMATAIISTALTIMITWFTFVKPLTEKLDNPDPNVPSVSRTK